MKHMKLMSQKPQKAQTTLETKLDNKLLMLENGGMYLFAKFGNGSID